MKKAEKIYKKDNFEVEIMNHNDKKIVDQLVCLEEKCFPMEMRNPSSYEYYSSVLNDPKIISLLLRYKGKIVGFLVAREYDRAYDDLSNHDPDLRENKKKLFYVDLIQIHPRFKINGGLSLLVVKLIEKSLDNKLKGFCLHARKKNGLSQFMQRIFSCKRLHSIDNWLGFGEQFDYLEFAVNKKIIKKLINKFDPVGALR
jgi:ribosomal protein S18 acetylase RimI-like enzyme